MSEVRLDLETRSEVDLSETGVYRYAADPSTDVWCSCQAVDDGPVSAWVPGQPCPEIIQKAVAKGWDLVAWNSNFERILWREILTPRYGWPEPRLEQWRCSMAEAYAMALPGKLDSAAGALGLDLRKDQEGSRVMKKMMRPRRNGGWWDDEAHIARLIEYCRRDVEVEREISKRLLRLRPFEQRLWHLDQRVNDFGIRVDVDLCRAAMKIVGAEQNRLDKEMRDVTEGSVGACSNTGQLVAWLRDRGAPTDSVAKGDVADLLAEKWLPPDVRRALELRQEAAKTSTAKIQAILDSVCADGRLRGLLQYHGASTGRWASRRVQIQNLPRPIILGKSTYESAIEDIRTGDADLIRVLWGPPMQVIADAVRGMFIA